MVDADGMDRARRTGAATLAADHTHATHSRAAASMKSEIIRRVSALNLTARQLCEVLSIIADVQSENEAVSATIEVRRAKDRARKLLGKSKENPRKDDGNSTDIPPENEKHSTLSSITKSLNKKEESKKERAKSSSLPDDWQTNEGHLAVAIKLGFDQTWMVGQAVEMREWTVREAHRSITKKADWNLTFLAWMRRAAKDARNGQGGSRQFQNDELSVTGAIRELGKQVEQGTLTFAPRPSLLPTEGGNDRRLLSKG